MLEINILYTLHERLISYFALKPFFTDT